MTKNRRVKIFKRATIIIIILGMITIHFFIPRLISEIRNPVVGLIKRNQNVSHKLIQNNNPNVNRKAITMESLLTVTKCLPF